jgi:zinc protease
MKIRVILINFCIISVILSIIAASAAAQPSSSRPPKEEKLLNGLRVLMWSDETAPKVYVKLRIHAGASFDPQEKEGVMKLLSETLFPNEEIREFFRDELQGSLEVSSNYDYIEINASSKPDQYLTMLETLANAVTSPVIDKATTEAVKSKLAARLVSDEKNASLVADLAVRKRLFETFPYGRPLGGSSISLGRIDFADLKFAYDRLFGADNATIAISGNFPTDVGYRAVRRYFGAWLKSDKRVPSTFRQPDPPPAGMQVLQSPEPGVTEMRYAVRGVARNDKDYAAASVLALILEQRIKAKAPVDQRSNVFVRNYSNVLPGVLVFGISKIRSDLTAAITSEKPKSDGTADLLATALGERVTDAEFNAAKGAVLSEYGKLDSPALWLDADTFRLPSVKADQDAFTNVSLADVQRFADRIKQQPVASVLVLTPKSAE